MRFTILPLTAAFAAALLAASTALGDETP